MHTFSSASNSELHSPQYYRLYIRIFVYYPHNEGKTLDAGSDDTKASSP